MTGLGLSRLGRHHVSLVLGACLVVAALTAGAGWYVGQATVDRQTARVTVRLLPLPGTAFFQRGGNVDVALRTEAQLARSDQVLSRVISSTGSGANVDRIRSRLGIRVLPSTEVVQLTYRAATRRQATRVASLVAESLLATRSAQSARVLNRQAELLEGQLDVTAALLAEAVEPGNRAEVLPLLVARTTRLQRLLIGTGPGPEAGYVVAVSSSVEPSERLERVAVTALPAVLGVLVVLAAFRWAARRADR